MQILIQMLRWGLRPCIPNKLPSDAEAASPGTNDISGNEP